MSAGIEILRVPFIILKLYKLYPIKLLKLIKLKNDEIEWRKGKRRDLDVVWMMLNEVSDSVFNCDTLEGTCVEFVYKKHN
jgi:hypothetical protein